MNGDETTTIRLTVNGAEHELAVDAAELLVELVRERLGLLGAHVGCGTGDCGACTVLVDGEARKSCLIPAARADGAQITTIEGLGGADGALHPLQRAFWDHYGFQCGFCTAGFVLAAVDLLARDPDPDEAAVRDAISGNLCRCTGYEPIVAAIRAAAAQLNGASRPAGAQPEQETTP